MTSRREFIMLLGGAALVPLAVRAQQAVPVIAWLGSGTAAGSAMITADFIDGLREAGFVAGRNVAIEYHWADGRYDRLPEIAAQLARQNIAVIVTSGVNAGIAAKAATTTIPVVFGTGADPIANGLVAALNRPGGNVTGISFYTSLVGKRLELLHSLVPEAHTVAVLMNPASPPTEANTQEVKSAGPALGLRIDVINASTDLELERAFEAMAKSKTRAVVIGPDSFFVSRYVKIVAFASRYGIPASYARPEYVRAGGLMSYAARITESYRQVGLYAARILKGERPSDLPVMLPTKFELLLNSKTARSLGLTIPATLLALADEVIE